MRFPSETKDLVDEIKEKNQKAKNNLNNIKKETKINPEKPSMKDLVRIMRRLKNANKNQDEAKVKKSLKKKSKIRPM